MIANPSELNPDSPSTVATPAVYSPGQRWPARMLPLLLIVAGILAYANSLNAPFIFDDFDAIKNNAGIRSLWPIWQAAWSPQDSPLAGRPVASLSFALNYAFAGGIQSTTAYHVGNLLIHLLTGLLLYGVIRRTLLAWKPGVFAPGAAWFALAASMLWLLHPIQTEAVAYLTQRTELLVGLFLLLTLYCSLRAASSGRPRHWTIAAIVSCALGMGSKEVMAAAPLLILIHDATFVSKSWKSALTRRWPLYLGLALTWLILAALLVSIPRGKTVGLGHAHINPLEYLMTQSGVILHYFYLVIRPDQLCIDYYDWPIARTINSVLPQFIVVAMLTLATLIGVMRRTAWGFIGAWILLILAPSSSIVPILSEVVAERRMYLPLAGLAVLVVWLIFQAVASVSRAAKTSPNSMPAAIAILLVAASAPLGWATHQRNALYSDEIALWQDAINKRPNNARARQGLGSALFELAKKKRDVSLYEPARASLEAALRINDNYENGHVGMGGVLMAQLRFADAEPHLRFAADAQPNIPERQFLLAYCLTQLGQRESAIERYQAVTRLDANQYRARYMLGKHLVELNRPAEALAPLRELQTIKFDEPDTRLGAWQLLAQAYAALGQKPEAIAALHEALKMRPGDATILQKLAEFGG